ncbi:MAG: response regulator [Spirochaetaceae bacterium]
MKIRNKILLLLLPPIFIGFLTLTLWAGQLAKKNVYTNSKELISLYLDSAIKDNINRRIELLSTTGLDKVENYVNHYQMEVLNEFKDISANTNRNYFVIDGNNKVLEPTKCPEGTDCLDWGNVSAEYGLKKSDNDNIYYGYRYVENWNWFVFVTIPEKHLIINIDEIRGWGLLIGIIILILIFLMIYFLSFKILSEPIQKLISASKTVKSHQHLLKLNINSHDEFNVLARSIEDMAQSIEVNSKELKDREKKYRQVIATTSDGFCFVDQTGNIIDVNDSYIKLSRFTRDELLNTKIWELESISDGNSLKNRLFELPLNGNVLFISKQKDKDGNEWIAEINLSSNSDGDNSYYIFFRDISKRILEGLEKEKLLKQLAQKNKMDAVGLLAGGIAHDFNNILGVIINSAELLKDKNNNEDCNVIDLILKSSFKASDLTKKLMAFGKKSKIKSSSIDMHIILTDLIGILDSTIDKKINLKANPDAKQHIIYGDLSDIQNAIMNISINSSHAMEQGGCIEYTTGNKIFKNIYTLNNDFDLNAGEYFVLEIKDNGKGISKENIGKIFEPFFTTKEQGKGTGLGLAAVYGIMKDHGGGLNVQSELGVGTTFTLYLPSTTGEVIIEKKNGDKILGKGTILLAEDEELLREISKAVLENLGYRVILAKNGKEATEIYKEKKDEIDLVLLDMTMPIMNGKEALIIIKKINPGSKIIMASGFMRDESLDELKELGLAAFIPKPYKLTELSLLLSEQMKS